MNPSQQAYAAAYAQAALLSGQSKPKEEPKNEFLESVKKVYCRRAEMWIRFVMGIGGVLLFAISPALAGELYTFWKWMGVITDVAFGGALLVGVFLGAISIASVLISFDGSIAKRWARDWVEQK